MSAPDPRGRALLRRARLELDDAAGGLFVSLDGLDDPVVVRAEELLKTDPLGLLRRLENRIQDLDRSEATNEQRSVTQEAKRARDRLGVSFPDEDALQAARRCQHEVNEQLLQSDEQVNAEKTLPERMISRMANATPSRPEPVRR